jgi:DNA-binding transcriptional LysR family regulator
MPVLLLEGTSMRFPQFSLEILMAVVATAEKKSVTRAGKELGISPSAVTKRIRVAERIARARLFHPAEEGFVLSQAGELLYDEAKKSIERALLGEEKIAAYLMLKERHLLVGHSTYLPPRLMAMLIQFHFEGAPPVEIEHRPELTPSIVQQVLDGTLHIGFGFLPQEHPDLTVRQLYEEPLVACLPASHPMSAKHTIYPEDLRGQALIAIGRRQMPSFQEEIDNFYSGFGVHLNVVADAFAPPEALAYVEQRIGICLLAQSSAIARPGIAIKPLSHRVLTWKSGMFQREDNHHELIREFGDQVWKKTAVLRARPERWDQSSSLRK